MTLENPINTLEVIRRSSAELLACAVVELFPEAQLVSGDLYDIGFYYDFIIPQNIDDGALVLIEERMRIISKEGRVVKSMEMMRENAAEFFRHHHCPLIAQQLMAVQENVVEVICIGKFYDLCRGPFVVKLTEIGAIKLFKIAPKVVNVPGMGEVRVVRIKGTAFADNSALKDFLKTIEQAKKRDHRQLGKELDLVNVSDETGPGFWVWHPKGAVIRELLLEWWRAEHRKQRFQPVSTPRVVKPQILQKAGFFDFAELAAGVFPRFSMEGSDYVMTPTNAPSHAMVFKSRLHSYREFPIRYAECSELYYQGKVSQLRGMFKARAYLADDATIFCSRAQALNELISSLQFIDRTIRIFGFKYRLYLRMRGEKYAGTIANWEEATRWMVEALNRCHFSYEVDPKASAFYGPRVEVRLIDALNREWSGPHVEVDFNHPERFGLRYQGADDEMHIPVMICRSMFGSLERFVAILVEHYAGQFPLWLAPEQLRVVPVGDEAADYAAEIAERLMRDEFRVSVDYRRETLGGKIYAAERAKVPYVVIVGKEEMRKQLITLRVCQEKQVLSGITLETLLQRLQQERTTKTAFGN